MRWLSIAAGLALIVVAFAAGSRVADTREGLIAEVVALLGGLAGLSLLLYGLFKGVGRSRPAAAATRPAPAVSVRPVRELAAGATGVLVGLVLLGGLAVSGGALWAGLGAVILLPMLAGSIYLCVRFARAPSHDWRWTIRDTSREEKP